MTRFSKKTQKLIKELPEPTGCNYGSHNMKYEYDDKGNCVSSTCLDCGAFYFGFHL